MELRKLGQTGLMVSTLGYGAGELARIDRPQAEHLLNALLDHGINYIDTSPDYGRSEEHIGKAIAHRRSEFFLATKCGCHIDSAGPGQPLRHIYSREQLLANLESSLRRLRTNHIDVWQLHNPEPEELIGGRDGEVIKTMIDLKREGKIRSIGITMMNGQPGDELYPAGYAFKYLPEFASWNVFDVAQIVYGGMTRQNEDLIAKTAQQGMGNVVRGILRRYHRNYGELFSRAKLGELSSDGESMDEFLIRFALSHPGISTMIVGTRNLEHLAANIQAAAQGGLTAATYKEAKRRLDAIGISPGKQAEP
jgi:aryl-alcohol dehydrogenase-like predicted oxidoreductase